MKKEFLYIYNFKQAMFFIDNGLKVVDIALGGKGDVYVKFIRDEECERVFSMWMDRG